GSHCGRRAGALGALDRVPAALDRAAEQAASVRLPVRGTRGRCARRVRRATLRDSSVTISIHECIVMSVMRILRALLTALSSVLLAVRSGLGAGARRLGDGLAAAGRGLRAAGSG